MKTTSTILLILTCLSTLGQDITGIWSTCNDKKIDQINSIVLEKDKDSECPEDNCSSTSITVTSNNEVSLSIGDPNCASWNNPNPPFSLKAASITIYSGTLENSLDQYTVEFPDYLSNQSYIFIITKISETKIKLERK